MNYEMWKKPKENNKSIASGHQLREPRLVDTLQNMVTHLLLEPCV